MPTIKEQLRSDLTEAIRSQDEITVATVRLALDCDPEVRGRG